MATNPTRPMTELSASMTTTPRVAGAGWSAFSALAKPGGASFAATSALGCTNASATVPLTVVLVEGKQVCDRVGAALDVDGRAARVVGTGEGDLGRFAGAVDDSAVFGRGDGAHVRAQLAGKELCPFAGASVAQSTLARALGSHLKGFHGPVSA
ncbi:hypothetical protein VTK73DRAFT_7220 [Phialemonium thermophilum]|uniref:Uncharacterized protein n=1 Tax=Phialemonium thermophilum TaxID=223376 RepID=A0ABR3WFM8_9PEZI